MTSDGTRVLTRVLTRGDPGDGRGVPGHLLPPLPAGRQHRQLQRLQQRRLHEVDGVSIRVSLSH